MSSSTKKVGLIIAKLETQGFPVLHMLCYSSVIAALLNVYINAGLKSALKFLIFFPCEKQAVQNKLTKLALEFCS